jgi:hypothetical protein
MQRRIRGLDSNNSNQERSTMPTSVSVHSRYNRILLAALGGILSSAVCQGQNAIGGLTFSLPPDETTQQMISIKLTYSGDDNENGSVAVRYRLTGSTAAPFSAMPLHRGKFVPCNHLNPCPTGPHVNPGKQFNGMIFGLAADTLYDVQLVISDPDGGGSTTAWQTIRTTKVPQAVTQRTFTVANGAELTTRLSAANLACGDLIQLTTGVFSSSNGFTIPEKGCSVSNPIVIRGSGVVPVAPGSSECTSSACSTVEGGHTMFLALGSNIFFENIQFKSSLNGDGQAIFFNTVGAQGNIVRGCRFQDKIRSILGDGGQKRFYIVDNHFTGRGAAFPCDWQAGCRGSSIGVTLNGYGHVVAHNYFTRFQDAADFTGRVNGDSTYVASRGVEFYGNEVDIVEDNAVEFDGVEANAAAYRNRVSNAYMPFSAQPSIVGPQYFFRNQVLNARKSGVKANPHENASSSGVYYLHNSHRVQAYGIWSDAYMNHVTFKNNIFLTAPAPPYDAVVVTKTVNGGVFDYNAYFPATNPGPGANVGALFMWRDAPLVGPIFCQYADPNFWQTCSTANNLDEVRRSLGYEMNGIALSSGSTVFEQVNGGIADRTVQVTPGNLILQAGAAPIDKAELLPNINDQFTGTAPDMGALERGLPVPTYGPRTGLVLSPTVLGVTAAGTYGGFVYTIASPPGITSVTQTMTPGMSSWVSSFFPAGCVGGTAIYGCLWVSPNTGAPRTGTITFTSTSGLTGTMTINQDSTAVTPGTVTVVPATISVPAAGGAYRFDITSPAGVTSASVASPVSWIGPAFPATCAGGTQTYGCVWVNANTTGTARTSNFTVTLPGHLQGSVTISQAAN